MPLPRKFLDRILPRRHGHDRGSGKRRFDTDLAESHSNIQITPDIIKKQNQKDDPLNKKKIPEGYSEGQIPQYTPEQIELYRRLFEHTGEDSYLSRLAGGDQSLFEEMEAPAMRQFQGLQGQLASRFSGAGMGSRHGSGFNIAANQQTADFAQDLASKRQELQRQAIMDLQGFSDSLLNKRPTEKFLAQKPAKYEKEKKSGGAGGWAGAGGAIVGGALGFFGGGPAGAAAGAKVGYDVGHGFD